MTVGYFLDLLIINAVRKEKLGDSLDDEVKIDLDKQDGFLLREIGKTLLEIAEGRFPRHDGVIEATFSLPSFNDNFDTKKGVITNTALDNELKEKVKKINI